MPVEAIAVCRLSEDIGYPIETKSSGTRGRLGLKPVDYNYEVTWNSYEFSALQQATRVRFSWAVHLDATGVE